MPATHDEVEHAAEAIGYGAVKYFDLKQNPATNYIFNYDKMLDTRGNTAASFSNSTRASSPCVVLVLILMIPARLQVPLPRSIRRK